MGAYEWRTVLSNDATLKSLTVSEGTLTPAFAPGITSYTVEVENEVSEITLSASATYDGASVQGTIVHPLNVGSNPINIKVTAEDGTIETYTVTVTRKEAPFVPDQFITFTWQGDGAYAKIFQIIATDGKSFTIDWGNGEATPHTGTGDWQDIQQQNAYGNTNSYDVTITAGEGCSLTGLAVYWNDVSALDVSSAAALTYLDCSGNQLTALNLSANTALTYLSCYFNQLTALDVSANTALEELICYENQLTALDISANTALVELNCINNQIPLSDLYAASIKSGLTDKRLGTQNLPEKTATTSVPFPLSGEMKLGGVNTTFAVTKNGAATGDYTLDYTNETITFTQPGDYEVTLTNTAIIANSGSEAKVNIPFTVTGGPAPTADVITFTWKGDGETAKYFKISATGDKEFTVDLGNGVIIPTIGIGESSFTQISQTYGDEDEYEVTITAGEGCSFFIFDIPNQNVTALDVSGATALTNLDCRGNRLPLSQLYTAGQMVSVRNNKSLGTQQPVLFETKSMQIGETLDLSAERIFNSVNTVFTVKKGTANATVGIDYSIAAGVITFLQAGEYTVEMTNSGIESHSSYPAKAITGVITVTGGSAPTGGITGFVYAMAIGTENSEPIQGATITVTNENGNILWTNATDALGKYTMYDIPVATYTVKFEAEGYLSDEVEDVEVTSNTATTIPSVYLDKIGATITTHTPADNATNVALDAAVSVTFSGAITAGANFANIAINGSTTGVSASISGAVLTIAHNDFDEDETYTVTIPAGALNEYSEVITWSFTTVTPNTHTITASAGAGGSISPSGAVSVIHGTNQTFTITPNNGYEIDRVLVDGQNAGAISTYTFENVTEDHTIAASFKVKDEPVLSNDATLASLTVSVGTLTPAFNKNTYIYTVEVENSVTKITLSATTSDSKAKRTGTGEKSLSVGSNPFDIIVTAEDGTIETYTVTVTRKEEVIIPPSDDATLASLTISAGTLTPAFNKNTTSYTVDVEYEVSEITLSATATHSGAKVEGTSKQALKVGENEFKIVVTAEDKETKKEYTITVTRADDDTSIDDVAVFRVYPNPASDKVFIRSNKDSAPEVAIFSLNGIRLLQKTGSEINIAHLPAGMYIIQVDGVRMKLMKK